MMTCQKQLFSLPPDLHYFNCAYKGPLMKSVEEIGIRAILRDRDPSRMRPDDFFSVQDSVRSLFAELINAQEQEIAIIPSTSYGFANVLKNTSTSLGRQVIMVKDEFPSEYYALDRWCKEHEGTLTIIAPIDNEDWTDRLIANISNDTAMVMMSSIHWMNGQVFDLEKVGKACLQHDVLFVVDGTQTVGALEMDVKRFHIDALICASYKWLFSPYSLALGYFGEKFHRGAPIEESWMNRTNARDFSRLTQYSADYTSGAGRYNVGQTSHFILLPMLEASLRQVVSWNQKKIQDYCGALKSRLFQYLGHESSSSDSKHLFGIRLPKGCNQELFIREKESRNISLSVRGEFLRISLHLYNDTADIDALIEAIEASKV